MICCRTIDDLMHETGIATATLRKLLRKKGCPQKTKDGYPVIDFISWLATNPKAYLRHESYFKKWKVDEFQVDSSVKDYAQELKKEQSLLTGIKKEREAIRYELDKRNLVEARLIDEQWAVMLATIKRRFVEAMHAATSELLTRDSVMKMRDAIDEALNLAFQKIQADLENINKKQSFILEETEEEETDNE